MIIYSRVKLEIGKIYGSDTMKGYELRVRGEPQPDIKFMVMREATEKEYKDFYFERYGSRCSEPPYKIFYQISVD